MRTMIRLTVGSLGVLLAVVAFGQAPPTASTPPMPVKDPNTKEAKPGSLEESLAEALKHNADVRVAESKLREAEAELNRVRMQVMQKVVALRSALETSQAAVKQAEAALLFERAKQRRMVDLRNKGAVDASVVDEGDARVAAAEQAVVAAKAKVGDVEAELGFLTGKHRAKFVLWLQQDTKGVPNEMKVRAVRADYIDAIWEIQLHASTEPGSSGEKLRKVLDKRVKVDSKNVALEELLHSFQTAHDVNFVLATKKLGETKVNVQVDGMPFGAVLEMLEDMVPGVRFAVRDYGILVTSAERLPEGAVPLYTFWKADKVAKPVVGTVKPAVKKP